MTCSPFSDADGAAPALGRRLKLQEVCYETKGGIIHVTIDNAGRPLSAPSRGGTPD
jgi:hypothetical protein